MDMTIFETMTEQYVKDNFEKVIKKAQQTPVKITKNEHDFVVMIISISNFEQIEKMKHENLQYKLDIATRQIADENLLDHQDVFAKL